MGKDFYKILRIRREASVYEIRKAYRKLAQRYHPDKNKHSHAARRFQQVAEAFEVLSDRKKRNLYNDLGERGLRLEGVSGYQFHSDPNATFAQFFGTNDVFAVGSGSGSARRPKNQAIEYELLVSLEEIAKGCIKRLEISLQRTSASGRANQFKKTLIVDILPGWRAGTRITFPDEGDKVPNRAHGGVVFVLQEKPHKYFRREGRHLRYTARISLKQALCGAHLHVPSLLGKPLLICTQGEVLNPNSTRIFPGQGLPYRRESSRRGKLIVDFLIEFPTEILQDNILDFIPSD
ncbi:dnaJ protein homolog 1-like [Drosophila subpulchrella]|uniref:dnaJ protein homolog 1-like n=1 Tax=Drosophila subpulchrella TaxID=1486046 RepID=UPI0018A185D9|nr:dnaJ protein homolog 1-like [Drosophila subpulchrella]XP_037720557.1 dnaJ protein homolog 1-like [Drosophila subpulchrella]